MEPFSLLVKYKSTVLHARRGEKGNIAVARELLGRTAGGIGVYSSSVASRHNYIQMVRNQGLVRNDQAERELL